MTPRLSATDLSILYFLAGGHGPARIAEAIDSTPRTARGLIAALRRTFRARTHAHLVALAVAQGLLDPAFTLRAQRLAARTGLLPARLQAREQRL